MKQETTITQLTPEQISLAFLYLTKKNSERIQLTPELEGLTKQTWIELIDLLQMLEYEKRNSTIN